MEKLLLVFAFLCLQELRLMVLIRGHKTIALLPHDRFHLLTDLQIEK